LDISGSGSTKTILTVMKVELAGIVKVPDAG